MRETLTCQVTDGSWEGLVADARLKFAQASLLSTDTLGTSRFRCKYGWAKANRGSYESFFWMHDDACE